MSKGKNLKKFGLSNKKLISGINHYLSKVKKMTPEDETALEVLLSVALRVYAQGEYTQKTTGFFTTDKKKGVMQYISTGIICADKLEEFAARVQAIGQEYIPAGFTRREA